MKTVLPPGTIITKSETPARKPSAISHQAGGASPFTMTPLRSAARLAPFVTANKKPSCGSFTQAIHQARMLAWMPCSGALARRRAKCGLAALPLMWEGLKEDSPKPSAMW